MGKLLRVELTKGRISEESPGEEFYREYVGGYGTGARILYDEVPPWVGAMDPDNLLIFSTGPITGTGAFSVGRFSVVFKSPMTGYFGDASCGGFWGNELKSAGYDMIVISGRSQKPVYLLVVQGRAELRSAEEYWTLDAMETDRRLVKDFGDRSIQVACIGQAGETLVRYAAIMHDDAGRAAGRCGAGAVMGSKNLKAVAVKGDLEIPVADKQALREYSDVAIKKLKGSGDTMWVKGGVDNFSKYGTWTAFDVSVGLGNCPTKNWTTGAFDEVNELLAGLHKIQSGQKRTCHNCPIACRRVVSFGENKDVEGPEYETIGALGTDCGISDAATISAGNHLCNIYGLDTISTGCTIAFSMECYEKGLIEKKDTDGVDLRFGNGEALLEMIHKIARRQGFGNILAEGTRRAARIIGNGADRYAIQVKGLEIAMHDPRAAIGQGIHYATTISGGRHTEGHTIGLDTNSFEWPEQLPEELRNLERFSYDKKAEAAIFLQNLWSAANCLGFCLLAHTGGDVATPFEYVFQSFESVTGKSVNMTEFMKMGERIFNLRKAFNVRHGATRSEDTLPYRLMHEPTNEGGNKGIVCDVDKMLPDYYRLRGWNPKESKPTKEKLEELGLTDIAEDLYL